MRLSVHLSARNTRARSWYAPRRALNTLENYGVVGRGKTKKGRAEYSQHIILEINVINGK